MFHLVHRWGRDKSSQETFVSTHETVEEAELDRIAEKLAADNEPENCLQDLCRG